MAVSITQDFINNAIIDARRQGVANPKDLVKIAEKSAEKQFGGKLGFHQTNQDWTSFPSTIKDPIHLHNQNNLNWTAEYGKNQVPVIYNPNNVENRALSELQGSVAQVKVNPENVIWSGSPIKTADINPAQLDGYQVQKLDLSMRPDGKGGEVPNNPAHQVQAEWNARDPEGLRSAKTDAQGKFHGRNVADVLDPMEKSTLNKYIKAGLVIVGKAGSLAAAAADKVMAIPGVEYLAKGAGKVVAHATPAGYASDAYDAYSVAKWLANKTADFSQYAWDNSPIKGIFDPRNFIRR